MGCLPQGSREGTARKPQEGKVRRRASSRAGRRRRYDRARAADARSCRASSASAAPVAGSGYTVVHNDGGNGPDAFVVLEHGVRPVFFCDPEKPEKQHNKCTVPVTNPSRF